MPPTTVSPITTTSTTSISSSGSSSSSGAAAVATASSSTTPGGKKKKGQAAATGEGATQDASSSGADAPSVVELDVADAEVKASLAARAAATRMHVEVDDDLMRMLGVTRAQDEFFASSTVFYNTRLRRDELEPDGVYRSEIWNWMEASTAKGQYRAIAKNIAPVYDIKKLYARIVEAANKASIISCIMEYKKVFTMTMREDIFQFHEELLQQMRVVEAQVEALGIRMDFPDGLEQNLLLIAAWQDARYRGIAEEIARKQRVFSLDELMRELQRQQLLTRHLNGTEKERARGEPEVRIKVATEKACWAFQKGSCTRSPCPFAHVKVDGTAAGVKKTTKPVEAKPGAPKKNKREICNFCKKQGHKESACRSKAGRATMAEAEDEECVARIADGYMSSEDEPNVQAAVLVAYEEAQPAVATAKMPSAEPATTMAMRSVAAARWCVDSGANRDMCNQRHLFSGPMTPKRIRIGEAGSGHSFTSEAEGAIPIHVRGEALPLLGRAIYAEKVSENILSVGEAVDQGYAVVFTNAGVEFHQTEDIRVPENPVLRGARDPRNRLYYICLPGPSATPGANTNTRKHSHGAQADTSNNVSTLLSSTYSECSEYHLWHARLGHVNARLMALAVPEVTNGHEKMHCDNCVRGKIHKLPHSGKRPTREENPWKPGEYFSCDLFGPLTRSIGGARYAAFYVDHKSRFVYAKPLKSKDSQYEAFQEVIVDARARSGRPMRFQVRRRRHFHRRQGEGTV
jgi:hypothetical protein